MGEQIPIVKTAKCNIPLLAAKRELHIVQRNIARLGYRECISKEDLNLMRGLLDQVDDILAKY